MREEKSCGAVIFRRDPDGLRYVIAQATDGRHGFPKGHVEPGETEQQTALREIREEVGLNVRLLDGFRKQIEYPLRSKPGTMKRVVFFTAAPEGDQPLCPQPEEILRAVWMTYEEARAALHSEELKGVMDEAHAFLMNLA